MQKKQEKKESRNGQAKANLSKLMASLDREKTADTRNQHYVELRKAPRGERYFFWLQETTKLCHELEELTEQIEQIEQQLTEQEQPEEQRTGQSDEQLEEESTHEVVVTWLESEEKVNDTDGLRLMQEKKTCVKELRRQREEKIKELRTAQQNFLAQLPEPERTLGVIYPGWNVSILMQYGVIACPGNRFHSPAELLSQVQPKSEQDKEQWLKGDAAYQRYFWIQGGGERFPDSSFLLVEIYMDQICVVYKDGRVIVV